MCVLSDIVPPKWGNQIPRIAKSHTLAASILMQYVLMQTGRRMQKNGYYKAEQSYEVISDEQSLIESNRVRNADEPWTGLAISGGGIRAASFAIGVLQLLASKNILKSFDYLSSVSGGGYASAALQWWWSKDRFSPPGVDASTFPFGRGRDGSRNVDNITKLLRWNGNYLTPGEGISVLAGVAVLVRSVLVNLFIWLSLLAGIFVALLGVGRYGPQWLGRNFVPNFNPDKFQITLGNPLSFLGIKGDWQGVHLDEITLSLLFAVIFWVAVAGLGYFLFATIVFSIASAIAPPDKNSSTVVRALKYLGVTLVGAASAWAFWVIYCNTGARTAPDDIALMGIAGFSALSCARLLFALHKTNYELRRHFEIYGGRWLAITACLLIITTLPILPYYLLSKSSALFGIVGALLAATGSFVAIFGNQVQTGKSSLFGKTSTVATIAAGLFLYAALVISYVTAEIYWKPSIIIAPSSTLSSVAPGIILSSVFGALVLAWLIGVNQLGLHRFYRDRLMEAFMPSSNSVKSNKTEASPNADGLRLTDIWRHTAKSEFPFPLFNTNAILIGEDDKQTAARGGDNFLLSPYHLGCSRTGWQKSESHQENFGAISVASAMAASGAAANAHSAYAGVGLTRSVLVATVMTALNLRLGLWIRSPSSARWWITPKLIHPALTYGMLRLGYNSKCDFLELSDGGHFENLGIYELARRRVEVIFAIDAEQDNDIAMPGLLNAVRRVRDDFNTEIKLENGLDRLSANQELDYPANARVSRFPFLVAEIDYGPAPKAIPKAPTRGVLIYVKASLLNGLDALLKEYRARYPDFPHQSTGDQFFDAEQFDAYRELGFYCAQEVCSTLHLANNSKSVEGILKAYRRSL